ncbi:hypothetical protein PoB_001008700 [Plakobranchus ocellatus]|uniref:Uncharacterized protein n=1 Tax=Plakobranchus ocellatus TaxID=259542 RepID=A0AAV3YKZ6_9GAST|nr:hypothetical protein PoB_001008700 [Plakobranchus ocellatus]
METVCVNPIDRAEIFSTRSKYFKVTDTYCTNMSLSQNGLLERTPCLGKYLRLFYMLFIIQRVALGQIVWSFRFPIRGIGGYSAWQTRPDFILHLLFRYGWHRGRQSHPVSGTST